MIDINTSSVDKVPLILIADDDRSLRTLLKLAMTEEGYQVIEAKNGQQCLSEYSRHQPDMILLDAVMPDMDGFSCCQHIRNLPGGKNVPILTVTVLDDPESVGKAFTAGTTDYITKPIHWAVLSQRVRYLLMIDRALVKAKSATEDFLSQQGWEKLFRKILQQLSQSSLEEDVLPTVMEDIRQFLQAERVIFYQPTTQQLIESFAPNYPSIQVISLADFLNLTTEYVETHPPGEIIVIEDITLAKLSSALIAQLARLKTQSLLIIPVTYQDQCQGWLWIHYAQPIYQWDKLSTERLLDLSKLLGIAQILTEHKNK